MFPLFLFLKKRYPNCKINLNKIACVSRLVYINFIQQLYVVPTNIGARWESNPRSSKLLVLYFLKLTLLLHLVLLINLVVFEMRLSQL